MTNKRTETNEPNPESGKKMASVDLSEKGMKEGRPVSLDRRLFMKSVSYTHLTLPTILLV